VGSPGASGRRNESVEFPVSLRGIGSLWTDFGVLKRCANYIVAARGRLIPFNSNSPTGSTFTAFSTFINTRGLMRICPGRAFSMAMTAWLGALAEDCQRHPHKKTS
jgi:hypothetical protein